MTRTSPPQVAFSAGEIDPLLHRRFDYQRYQTGLKKCHGFLPLPQGGITRAPGSTYLGAPFLDRKCRLVPFQFAANDAMVLEFTAGVIRFWRYGTLVLKPDLSGPYELASPYLETDLPNLQWVQSADVIYMVDGRNPVQRLARAALNSWTIGDAVFENGPFRVQNLDKALTVQASATSGTVTLTASAALFQSGHVGSLFLLRPTDMTGVQIWTSNTSYAVGALVRVGNKVYRQAGTSTVTCLQDAPIHEEGKQNYGGGIVWEYLADDTGIVEITAVTSATVATATVKRALPPGVKDDPTYRWAEAAWSDIYGYPASIEIFDQRLVLAATPGEPRTIWFSTVGAYLDFLPSVEADGAFAHTIAGIDSQNAITGLRRGRTGLHIFAMSEELSSRSDSRAQVIGPTNAVFSQDGSSGARPGRPISPGGDPMIISRDGRRLVLIRYDIQAEGNREANLSRASQHLGDQGFARVVWQQTPEPRAWILRDSGDLAHMIYDADEEVLGWGTHSLAHAATLGVIEDIIATQNEDGTEDQIWIVASYRPASAGFGEVDRSIERLDFTHHLCRALVLPAEDPPSGTASVALPWLAGRDVLVEGVPYEAGRPPFYPPLPPVRYTTRAANGTGLVTFAQDMASAVVGLFDDSHEAETLDIVAAAPDGNTTGRLKRLGPTLGIGLHDTEGGTVQAVESHGPRQSAPARPAQAILPPALGEDRVDPWSGVTTVDCPTGHALGLSLRFRPEGNAKMTITGVFPTVSEGGR